MRKKVKTFSCYGCYEFLKFPPFLRICFRESVSKLATAGLLWVESILFFGSSPVWAAASARRLRQFLQVNRQRRRWAFKAIQVDGAFRRRECAAARPAGTPSATARMDEMGSAQSDTLSKNHWITQYHELSVKLPCKICETSHGSVS